MNEETSLPFDFNDDVPSGSPDAVFFSKIGEFQYFGPGSDMQRDPYVYPMNDMDTGERDDEMLLADFFAWLGEKSYVIGSWWSPVTTEEIPATPTADELIKDYMKEDRL